MVWVFVGEGSRLPSAVFSTKESAETWIERHRVSGILTAYPVGAGVYDWAIDTGRFRPKSDEQKTSSFIGRFTCAFLEHSHYVDGKVDHQRS